MGYRTKHVTFVSFVGLRCREQEFLALGITLPGLAGRHAAVAQLPALGLLTLAGMLPADWTCTYHEADQWNEALLDNIAAERPAVVAISALTAGILEAYSFCSELRKREIPTVIGGLHATACPDEAVQFCDAVVVGDGEAVWHQLLNDAYQGRLAKLYQSVGAFDLSQSQPPRFELVAGPPRSRYTIQTQRGCPLACEFCAASRLLGGFREKPAALIRNELEVLKTLVADPVVELADDNTFAGSRNPDDLFSILRDAGIRYFTESDWRIGEKPRVLEGLAESGCVQVLVGIESLVHNYHGFGQKRADLSRIMAALDAIQDHGVAVVGCFVIGADGETASSLERLTKFLLDTRLADVQVTMQTPFPGSPLYRKLERAGRLLPDRNWNHHTLFDVTFLPDQMSVAELERGFRDMAAAVYSGSERDRRRSIRRRTWRKSVLASRGQRRSRELKWA
ncbi:MAG: radical SAM protein [Bryobacteraceae bacterium]